MAPEPGEQMCSLDGIVRFGIDQELKWEKRFVEPIQARLQSMVCVRVCV